MKLVEKNILLLPVILGAGWMTAPGMRVTAMVATATALAVIVRKGSPVREPARARAITSYRSRLAANLRKRF